MVSEVSATSCAQLFPMDLCRVSVCGSVSGHIVEVMDRAARGVRKARFRSAASTQWVLARSARRARAYLFESCRVGRVSRELRHADGGNHVGLMRAPNHFAKINYWCLDTIHVQWLTMRKLWQRAVGRRTGRRARVRV